MRRRLQDVVGRYGAIALSTYAVIFVLVLAGFSAAIALGLDVDSAGAGLGTIGAAYVATKVTQPLRIAATIVLTPVVARVLAAVRGRPAAGSPGPGDEVPPSAGGESA